MNAYLIVFASAFGAATILPFYSEVVVLAYQQQGYPAGPLWLAATSGNTLGAVLNWWIGRELTRFQGRRWFPVSAAALQRAQERFARWGQWSLLMAWTRARSARTRFARPLVFVAFVSLASRASSSATPSLSDSPRQNHSLRLSD